MKQIILAILMVLVMVTASAAMTGTIVVSFSDDAVIVKIDDRYYFVPDAGWYEPGTLVDVEMVVLGEHEMSAAGLELIEMINNAMQENENESN